MACVVVVRNPASQVRLWRSVGSLCVVPADCSLLFKRWSPLLWASAAPSGCRCFASSNEDQAGEHTDMERAVSEQTKVLFPRLQELELAQKRRDEVLRSKAVSSTAPSDWSPQQVPYKLYDKNTSNETDGDSTDDESEDAEEKAEAAATTSVSIVTPDPEAGDTKWEDLEAEELRLAAEQEPAPLEEELGFRYKGPEPTLHGDWAHKGRCTDF